MARHEDVFFRQEDMKNIFFDKKTKQRLLQEKSVKTWIIKDNIVYS